MKVGFIVLLAAGPLVVRAQVIGFDRGVGGLASDCKPDSIFFSKLPPGVQLPGYRWTPFPDNLFWRDHGKHSALQGRDSLWMSLPPDRMPCLVPRRVNDRMKIDRRGNGDKMANRNAFMGRVFETVHRLRL